VLKENGFAVLVGEASIAWKLFDFGVSVLFALSAPIVAFISSEVMAITLAYRNNAQSRLDAEYAKQVEAWRASANEAWSHQKRNWGGSVRVESVPVGALSDYNSSNLIKNDEITRQKPSIKLNKALSYLREHPEHLATAPRELEKEIVGISYGTIHKAQVMLRSEVES